MSDEREARAWDAAIEALERAEVLIPARLARRRRRPGLTIFGGVVSAVLVLLLSVLLGHDRDDAGAVRAAGLVGSRRERRGGPL